MTFVVGILSPWMVHDWPDGDVKFLTPLEKEAVLQRLKADSGLANQGTFSWRVVRRAAMDWKTWVLMLMYIGVAEGIYSQSIFTPTIIAALGKWSRPQSLLLSTPPYAWAFITTMTTAYLSDKTGRRGFFLMFWTLLSVVGYIIFITVPLNKPVSTLLLSFCGFSSHGSHLEGRSVFRHLPNRRSHRSMYRHYYRLGGKHFRQPLQEGYLYGVGLLAR